jgi:hypothetical protein
VSAATYRGLAARRILQFWRNLKPSFSCADFFFVHAGVRSVVATGGRRPALDPERISHQRREIRKDYRART